LSRSLYSLFESRETTVAGWIRDRRLERCRRDLLDRNRRDVPASTTPPAASAALATRASGADNHAMAVEPRMVFLGFGKFARADKIYALEPLRGDQRGDGRRTNVWVEGIDGPIVASRTERTILHDMGQDPAAQAPIVDEALDLAERLVAAADAGRVDLGDLGRRARHLLAATTGPSRDASGSRG
jgi:hypothetical protein